MELNPNLLKGQIKKPQRQSANERARPYWHARAITWWGTGFGWRCQLIITSRTEGSEDRIGNRGNSVIVSDSLIEMISN
jgi:hypothetical protein